MNNKKNRLIIGICAGLLILITFIASLITKKTDVSGKTGMELYPLRLKIPTV